jgi:hypothetical protein
VVSPGALDFPFPVLEAAPEVPAAHHKANLNAKIHTFFNNGANASDDVKVKAEVFFPGQRFAADFE